MQYVAFKRYVASSQEVTVKLSHSRPNIPHSIFTVFTWQHHTACYCVMQGTFGSIQPASEQGKSHGGIKNSFILKGPDQIDEGFQMPGWATSGPIDDLQSLVRSAQHAALLVWQLRSRKTSMCALTIWIWIGNVNSPGAVGSEHISSPGSRSVAAWFRSCSSPVQASSTAVPLQPHESPFVTQAYTFLAGAPLGNKNLTCIQQYSGWGLAPLRVVALSLTDSNPHLQISWPQIDYIPFPCPIGMLHL